MAFVTAAAIMGGASLLGAAGGMLKGGPDLNTSGLASMQAAQSAYGNLLSQGANGQDVANATNAQRGLAATYQQNANNPMGMYDFAGGKQLATQQFAGQRQQLAQSMQNQITQAQQAASAAGRSAYDPILMSRLAGQNMQNNASLNAQQSSAEVGFAGQLGAQRMQNQVNSVNTLTGLADQAFQGQQAMFGMGQGMQGQDNAAAQYGASQGGGLKGALTGVAGGIGSGMSLMGGFAQMGAANSMAGYYNSMTPMSNAGASNGMGYGGSSFTMPQMGSMYGGGAAGFGVGGAGRF